MRVLRANVYDSTGTKHVGVLRMFVYFPAFIPLASNSRMFACLWYIIIKVSNMLMFIDTVEQNDLFFIIKYAMYVTF